MSVTGCEVDRPSSPGGGDYCCTEEELFESFMEIVNDPELQGQSSSQEGTEDDVQQSDSVLKNSVLDETYKEKGLSNEENEQNTYSSITSDTGSLKDLHQVNNTSLNGTVDNNQVSLQESSDNHTNDNTAQHLELSNTVDENLSSVKNDDKMELQSSQESANTENISRKMDDKGVEDLEISETKNESVSLNDNQHLESNESIISVEANKKDATNNDPEQINPSELASNLEEMNQSNVEQAGQMSSQQSSNQSKTEVVSSILLRQPTSVKKPKEVNSASVQQPTSPSDVEIVSSILLRKPTSPKKPERASSTLVQQPTNENEEINSTNQGEVTSRLSNQNEAEGSSTNQNEEEVSSSNQNEAEVSLTNQSEADVSSTNQNEAEVSSTNQSEAEVSTSNQNETEVSLTNQSEAEVSAVNESELQSIESSIEEGIRKANQVCEELNALTQRFSQSSDELLDDSDSDSQKTDRTNLTTVSNGEPGVVNNGELPQNNNIETSKLHSHSKDENHEIVTSQGADPTLESKRPNTLPELIVTSQASNSPPISPKPSSTGTTPSPMYTAPSPSIEPSTSPLGVSPTHITHLKDDRLDRKCSMSDSLDSSEGSLSGDTKSLGASPSPTQGREPFNWEILNTALGDADSDEEDGVYESPGGYGGFGLVLDDDSPEPLAVDDPRYRSVSQSSTVSEVEFKEQYKKQHSVGSLERNSDGVLCSGYLFKLGGTGITPKNWRKRWCVLRQDRCLYYYKTARDKIPCGIIVLANYIVSHSSECNKKNCIKLSKGGGRTYFFCSDTPRDMLRWMEALRKAAEISEEGTSFVIRKEIIHNVAIPALSIKKPDCHGYLTKQGAKTTRSWKRRYCVLKNGCLYYYREMADTTALGVAKLHGYMVDEVSVTGRRNGFRCVPPHSGMRTFTFVADNEYDKKRWIPCFRESIRANTPTDE